MRGLGTRVRGVQIFWERSLRPTPLCCFTSSLSTQTNKSVTQKRSTRGSRRERASAARERDENPNSRSNRRHRGRERDGALHPATVARMTGYWSPADVRATAQQYQARKRGDGPEAGGSLAIHESSIEAPVRYPEGMVSGFGTVPDAVNFDAMDPVHGSPGEAGSGAGRQVHVLDGGSTDQSVLGPNRATDREHGDIHTPTNDYSEEFVHGNMNHGTNHPDLLDPLLSLEGGPASVAGMGVLDVAVMRGHLKISWDAAYLEFLDSRNLLPFIELSNAREILSIYSAESEVNTALSRSRASNYHYSWLRDHCRCDQCVDPFSGQKKHNASDLDLSKVAPVGISLGLSDIDLSANSGSLASVSEKEERRAGTKAHALFVKWNDGHRSEYPLWWLKLHDYSLMFGHVSSSKIAAAAREYSVKRPQRNGTTRARTTPPWSPGNGPPAPYAIGNDVNRFILASGAAPYYAGSTGGFSEVLGLVNGAVLHPSVFWSGGQIPHDGPELLPTAKYEEVMNSDTALCDYLERIHRYGVVLLRGMPNRDKAVAEVGERICHLRETMYGKTFDVKSVKAAINVAYTSAAIDPHTDICYYETTPGFQFLHCRVADAEGGANTFVDGIAVASMLREIDPEAFFLLSHFPRAYHKNGPDHAFYSQKPVISLTPDGEQVSGVYFSAPWEGVLRIPFAAVPAYYRAYTRFVELVRSADFRVSYRMQPGEMVGFHNRRLLHARTAFDPSTGDRHLQGTYVDFEGFYSRLTTLKLNNFRQKK